ncbi:MAG: alpha/beta hydrolase [Eubacteriales bacterium]
MPIAYREAGDGFPLVMLHGNGEDGRIFERQVAFFSRFYRVITPDTRGHGQSPRGEGAFTLARFAEDLHVLLQALGLERVHLYGFSDGGNIALLLALKYPTVVEKLVLGGANLSPAGLKSRCLWQVKKEYLRWSIKERLHRCALRPGKADRRAAWEEARRRRELFGLMAKEPHLRPRDLTGIRAPTLVMAGTRDLIRLRHSLAIAHALPHAAFCELPGGHHVHQTNSEWFNRVLLAFLEADTTGQERP